MKRNDAPILAPPFEKGGLGGIPPLPVEAHPSESPLTPLFQWGGHRPGVG
jgi:hypothetical protein